MAFEANADGTTRRSFLRGTAAAAGATVGTGATVGATTAQSEPDYGDWFSNTGNFDGTYDFTGESEVTVRVGAKGNGGNFAFSPAAIRVDPGTKVTWEWTGKGGSHNVVADGGSFESKLNSQKGATFTHTFEEKGTYKYFCSPHKPMGMKGAVVAGGSGGKDPSTLDSGSSGGESAGGSGDGSSGDEGHSSGEFSVSLSSATIVTAIVMAFLSPVVFGVLLLLNGSDEDGE